MTDTSCAHNRESHIIPADSGYILTTYINIQVCTWWVPGKAAAKDRMCQVQLMQTTPDQSYTRVLHTPFQNIFRALRIKKSTPNAIVFLPWTTAQKKHWMEINRSYMVSRNTLVFKVWCSNIQKPLHPPICLAVPLHPDSIVHLIILIFLSCSTWPSDTPCFNKQQWSNQKKPFQVGA